MVQLWIVMPHLSDILQHSHSSQLLLHNSIHLKLLAKLDSSGDLINLRRKKRRRGRRTSRRKKKERQNETKNIGLV